MPIPQPSQPVRVLIVDDSAFMRTALRRMMESDAGIKAIDTAQNGIEAIEKAARLDPDVITLDIEMPLLDGLGALKRLMSENPKPVIMISSLTQEGAEATMEAFNLGAFDCIPKQLSYASLDILEIRDELIGKIKAAAASPTARRKAPRASMAPQATAPVQKRQAPA